MHFFCVKSPCFCLCCLCHVRAILILCCRGQSRVPMMLPCDARWHECVLWTPPHVRRVFTHHSELQIKPSWCCFSRSWSGVCVCETSAFKSDSVTVGDPNPPTDQVTRGDRSVPVPVSIWSLKCELYNLRPKRIQGKHNQILSDWFCAV